MRALTGVLLALAACAHVNPAASGEERVFDVPLGQALAEAAAVLAANGISVHPVDGQPGVLASEVVDWDSTKLGAVPWWARNRIAVLQRSRWLVIGRALGPRRSAVQILHQVENDVTNEAPRQARAPRPELVQRWNRESPIERLDAAPVEFEPFEHELAARLDALVAVETLSPSDAPIVDPQPLAPGTPPPDQRVIGDCGINSGAIDGFFAPGHTLLLGDQLGSNEAPEGLAALVCTALHRKLEVIVALSLPATEQTALNAFLDGDGGATSRAALVRGPFWESLYPDGTSSVAMLELIETLRRWRRAGAPLTVLAIDATTPGNAREAAMAARIENQQMKQPDAFTVVLAGNVHVTRAVGAGWDSSLLPLGHRLATLDHEGVLALDLAFDAGMHWACRLQPKGHLECGEVKVIPGPYNTEALPPNVKMVRRYSKTSEFGFDGTCYVGRLTTSPPAASPDAAISHGTAQPGRATPTPSAR